jgi:hypothetical protein
VIAVCEDGYTMLWVYDFIDIKPRMWPSTNYAVRKFFIQPIEDEL